MKNFSGDRYGIIMIIAALLVISIIAGQFLLHRQEARETAIKAEGRNVSRLLSNLPYQQLIPEHRPNGIVDLLNTKHTNSDFAYAAIVSLTGQPIAVSSSGETIIPNIQFDNQTNLWATEHEIPSQNNKHTLIEFRAPVLNAGELAGYVRVGYFKPSLKLTEISFIAQLALPIFLLVPLMYLLIGRELKPLKQASIEINEVLQKQHLNPQQNQDENFQGFMNNFEHFMTAIDQRFNEISQNNLKSKASGLALTYQRQRAESALQSLPDAILIMDDSGKATYANSKLFPLVGSSMEKIIGAKAYEWCKNDDILKMLEKYQNHQQRFQRSDSIDFIPEHNPNITVSVNAYPLFTPKEKDHVCGTLVIFKDKSQEIFANKAREEFINHVSHELKSPLNVIHMYAESLLEPDLPHDQLISSINVINDEVERLSNLINNLLNISKIEAGNVAINLQRVKLNEFLSDIFYSIARSGNTNDIQFELDLPNNLPNIQLDKDLLRVAINNLLTNAVKYNNPLGKVTFSAEETDDEIILKIQDTGIGIAEKDQANIFEKFYRSDDDSVTERNGHGLGLALAKEIIELHQGKVQIESTLGEGSLFTIVLQKTSSFLR